ncbi:L-fucose isomerase [Rhodohalobacter sp. 614A]|uniref:L-fucose isomerase n=1 Tax=Rhodohalobacter sp. 614A TaxID=2908649 RepID=UPI001F39B764|nr:L-fucose isomerase [Rhodohalobacter sp. 614A]
MKISEGKKGQKRVIGRTPKVGIRPVIDGRRRGVRESLEEQTMNMAKNAAAFITENITHSNGLPVECVIADTCIGGVAEAARAAQKFEEEGVGVSLTVTPCWCYGSETMDMHPWYPKAIWGFNGSERPGAVYLAATKAAHEQKGLPVFSIYGSEVQDAGDETIPEDVQEKMLLFVKAGLAVAEVRGKSYLSIGSVSMGIVGSMIQEDFFEDYFGMRCEAVDMSELTRRMNEEIYDQQEFSLAMEWVKQYCKEGEDINAEAIQQSREKKDENWETVVKMTLIIRDLMIGNPTLNEAGYEEEALGHNAIASGFQGQRQWTDHFPNGDFSEAILNSSFDWNGIREPFVVATENDTLNAVCMLLGHLMTNSASIFGDIRTYWSPESVKRVTGHELEGKASGGIIHFLNSGSATLDGTGRLKENGASVMKPYWDISPEEAEACLDATRWCPANLEYFRGGGYSSQFCTQGEMPVTMTRINLVKGLGPVLQIAEGFTVDIPGDVHKTLNRRTDPIWPTTWFVPNLTDEGAFKDVYSVMNNWGSNHGVINYGHVGDAFITLASMLRIPVSMHNVPEQRVFRPSAWAAFGTSDLESADYRACGNFGPVFGKSH